MSTTQHARAFLWMLGGVWGATLFMCAAQAGICEFRAKGQNGQCGQEWQLAIVTAVGMGQTLFSLFATPPTELRKRETVPGKNPNQTIQ